MAKARRSAAQIAAAKRNLEKARAAKKRKKAAPKVEWKDTPAGKRRQMAQRHPMSGRANPFRNTYVQAPSSTTVRNWKRGY